MFGPTVHLLQQHDNTPESWQPKIPRILHQTTATNEIPDMWVESQKSCMDAYSDFEYKVVQSPCNCSRSPLTSPALD